MIRPWIFNVAFTLSFSPFLMKAYMVHKLFNISPMSKSKFISLKVLLTSTVVFLLIDWALISIMVYGVGEGAVSARNIELINGAETAVTYCTTTRNTAFLVSELLYKGLMIGAACVLAFLVRNIHGTIAGSRTLLIIVYNVAFVSGFVLLIVHNVTDVGLAVIAQVVGICFCCLLAVGMLLVPLLYSLATVGDDAGAEAVLDDLFQHSQQKYSTGVKSPEVSRRRAAEGSHQSAKPGGTQTPHDFHPRTFNTNGALALQLESITADRNNDDENPGEGGGMVTGGSRTPVERKEDAGETKRVTPKNVASNSILGFPVGLIDG